MALTASTKTPLYGREPGQQLVSAALARAGTGTAQVVDVTGESGIGKTSLWLEVLEHGEAITLTGHCLPLAGGAMPFTPVIAALRGLAGRLDPVHREQLLHSWPSEFAAFIPSGFGDPASGDAGGEEPAEPVLSTTSQSRLFEGLLRLLGDLARSATVVWLIEDVHWADRSTLDLVVFLARNLTTERVVLGLTMRTDDLHRQHPLRPWLAELDRLSTVTRIDLGRLSREATAQQLSWLAAQAGIKLADSTVDLVFDRSAGNPFFTQQLLPWTADPSQQLPHTLHDLVAARLARLTASARTVLEVAAVLGRGCDLDVLAEVSGSDEGDVEMQVAEAVDQRIMQTGPGVDYTFVHPLFRDVLEADLLPGRRRSLHASAALCLERRSAGLRQQFVTTGKIAHHWERAGATDRAFAATVRAGLAAERLCAVTEADEYFSRALTLQRDTTDLDIGGPDQVESDPAGPRDVPLSSIELLLHASQAAHLVGAGTRAVELADRALNELTRQHAEPARRSEVLERKGAYCFNAGRFEDARQAYQTALALLPVEPSPARARVLSGIGLLAMAWTRIEEAEEACREAIQVARAVGARREEGRALNALGVVTVYQGHFDAGITFSRRAVEIVEQLDNADDLSTAYIDLTHVLGLAGRYDEAVEAYHQGYAAIRRVGLVRQDGSFLQANLAESLIKAGRWEEAAQLLTEAMAQRPQGLRAFPVLEHSARLHVCTGRLDDAEASLAQARALLSEHGAPDAWRREFHEVDAEYLLWRGRPDEALGAAEAGLALASTGDETRFTGTLTMVAARALADLTEAARARRDEAEVERRLEQVHQLRTRAHETSPSPLAGASHPLIEGAAMAATITAELRRAEALDGVDAGELMWSEAARQWDALDQPFPAAYARWRAAEVLVSAKYPGERPVTAVRKAFAAATGLGASGLAAEIEHLARWGRIDLISATADAGPSTSDRPDLGLTPRESEVLAGLMAGQTNREIATSLFISVKTASVHVSNILRKLGVSSREEAARAAHRHHTT